MKLTIKEIEQKLSQVDSENDEFVNLVKNDERKGVQNLIKKWQRKIADETIKHQRFEQMLAYERPLWQKGHIIAGIDEVGRGPLAGPVVAAAVIIDEAFYLPGINDSKKLTEKQRNDYFDYICANAKAIGIGMIDAARIDELNIYQATIKAMEKAIVDLAIKPNYLLIDAMTLPMNILQKKIIKGDEHSVSIAAASIVAKVTRDRLMKKFSQTFPHYQFDKNMGYGTSAHLEAIKTYGITELHRRSFAPIKERCE